MSLFKKIWIGSALSSFLFAPHLRAEIDVYGPKPFYQILDSEFSPTWAPNAISTIENRKHVVLLDAATKSFCLSIEGTSSSTLTVTSLSDITDGSGTYGTALRSMFQVLDQNTEVLASKTLTGAYRLQPELLSYSSVDAGSSVNSITSSTLAVRDRSSFYVADDVNATIAYLLFTFSGTASSTKIQATSRYLYNRSAEDFEIDANWSASQWLVMTSSSISLTSIEADATAFFLADATDLIDFGLDAGSNFNPGSTEWQTNTFASFPTDGEGNQVAWAYEDSDHTTTLLQDIDDFYEKQFVDHGLSDEEAAAAASQALDAIEATLTAENASLRYDKSVYLAYRENALSHRYGALDIYNARLGERTIAQIFFVNGEDSEGVHHPFMVIASHDSSGGPNFLIDVPRPPGDGLGGQYPDQTITRRAVLGNRFVKVPLKDYGLIGENAVDSIADKVAENDLVTAGISSLAADKGVPAMEWNTLNHTGNSLIGIAIDGVVLYPAYNDTLTYATAVAEITTSGIHVGKGGGLHYHGDGHAHNNNGINLYNLSDYEGHSHPPLIGFSFDGVALFGRYESTIEMEGDDTAIDEFGGHSHGDYGYHYHAHDKENIVVDGGPGPDDENIGPYTQHFLLVGAWKGNINSIPGFSGDNSQLKDESIKHFLGAEGTAAAVIAEITTQPQGSSIDSGSSATLTVAATNATSYQWYSGTSGDISAPLAAETSASITVSPTTTSSYWVNVGGTEGFMTASETATVTVSTGGSTYETWAQTNISTGDSSQTGDPDSDGIKNLLEYALDLNPKVVNPLPLTVSSNTTTSTISYVRPENGVNGLTYTLQFSTDLETWLPQEEPSISINSLNNGFETVSQDITATAKIFARLLVQEEASP